ncbi:MAG TPA: hypothetical protein VFA20_08000 [Myxococcaceae bacterium]|nr:hypothetical protein [Myxococcaceae bacterium]
MSRSLLSLALPAALLAAAACWVPELPWLDGKACDDTHLCIRGVCLAGQCVLTPPGKDASTPVLVTRSTLHALDDGTVVRVQEVPANLDMLVETSGGGFVALQPTVADAGLMIFWDAPAPGQPYVLRLGTRHFVSDAGMVDLSERVLGRPDLVASGPGTSLRTQLNCLSLWDVMDEIQLTAAGAGVGGLDLATLPGWTPPAASASQLNTSESWTTAATPGLIQTSRGDFPVYLQLEHNTFNQGLPDGGSVAAHRWQSKHTWHDFPLEMSQGAQTATPLACTSSDINPRGADQFDLRGAAFGAFLAGAGNGATLSTITVSLRQAAWPAGPGPDVYRNGLTTADDLKVSSQLPNNSPFPATWANEAVAVASGIVPVVLQLDGGSTTAFEPVVLVSHRAFPVDGGELAPAVGPPQLVMVNGTDAAAGVTGVGVQPEITWSAPALGTPAIYEVSIWREQDPSRQKAPRLEGTVWTDATRIRIPPGLMTPGATYVLHVRAVSAPMDPLRAPLLSGLPYDEAELVSGLIEP